MRLEALVQGSISAVLDRLGLSPPEIPVERPPRPEFGDLTSRVAFLLAQEARRPPQTIAQDLARELSSHPAFSQVQAVQGFLNFFLRPEVQHSILREILRDGLAYGKGEEGRGKKLQVEFVSSNPTGPLTIGHGRQAALGDVLANLFSELGWQVTREYYLNDEGRQIELLAQSLWARYRQALGDPQPIPEGGYHGDYLIPIGQELAEKFGNAYPEWNAEAKAVFRAEVVPRMLRLIEEDLEAIGVRFDVWTREGEIIRKGLVDEVLRLLRERKAVYEKDGAIWLSAKVHGLGRDPVLIRSDGTPTYLMVDIAYHLDKFRRGFDWVVDVQGADHIEEQQQVKLALRLLGFPEGFLSYCLHQFVTLKGVEGIEKMSTRAGRFLRLKDLVDEVGRDATRYFMVMRKPESHLVFDFELAKKQSLENPVYYVQYAHTRIASVFREAQARGELPEDFLSVDLSPLKEPEELRMIAELDRFPDVVRLAAREFAPHLLCEYLENLAGIFHPYYARVRILGQGPATPARLALLAGVKLVLFRGLSILGVNAPEEM
ncbi:arginine--tRNA ligase [Candidatus Bipolaricaulota bacterium]|nr:arginine--tRNA ligase [Candidatus Bipolaricaulota bacterium]